MTLFTTDEFSKYSNNKKIRILVTLMLKLLPSFAHVPQLDLIVIWGLAMLLNPQPY